MNEQPTSNLSSLTRPLQVAVLGATGGLGRALCQEVSQRFELEALYCLSRSGESVAHGTGLKIDLSRQDSIESAGASLRQKASRLDLIINCAGLLHADGVQPEKSLGQLSGAALDTLFKVNCSGPMLFAQAVESLIQPEPVSVFANISARVGSIEDNRLGGWYGYRSSKAALNMMLKTLSIEWARRKRGSVVAMFQPGTVETRLSRPFLGGQSPENIKTPEESAARLVDRIGALTPADTGSFLDWKGERIPF